MPKEKNIADKNITETPGDRLNAVIVKYFGSQTIFTELIKIDKGSLSRYISDRKNLTKNSL